MIAVTSGFMKYWPDGTIVGVTPCRSSSEAMTGPTAATAVRRSAAVSRSVAPRSRASSNRRLACEALVKGDRVDPAGGDFFDQPGQRVVGCGGGIVVRGDRIGQGADGFEKIGEAARRVRVKLHTDALAAQIEAGEQRNDAFGCRRLGAQLRGKTERCARPAPASGRG